MTQKKWVFQQLVENDEDFVGFIAYTFYKLQKHDLADSHRSEGKTEDEINAYLTHFHDQTVNNPRALQDYRDKASTILNDLIDSTEERVKQALQAEFDSAQANFKEAHQGEIARIHQSYRRKSKLKWFQDWTISGFAGIWAAFLSSIFIYGLLILFTSSSTERADLIEKGAKEVMSTLAPSSISKEKPEN